MEWEAEKILFAVLRFILFRWLVVLGYLYLSFCDDDLLWKIRLCWGSSVLFLQ